MSTESPPASVTIRTARATDVPAIVALVRDVLAEFGLTFGQGSGSDDHLAQLPSSYVDSGGQFWVAVDASGDLLGTAGMFPVADGTFELRKMYLRSRGRGQRIGQRLLEESLTWARLQGGKRAVLDTVEQMTRAIAFYEANGFRRDDSQMRAARCSRGYVKDL